MLECVGYVEPCLPHVPSKALTYAAETSSGQIRARSIFRTTSRDQNVPKYTEIGVKYTKYHSYTCIFGLAMQDHVQVL